jgi:hypothetical protein
VVVCQSQRLCSGASTLTLITPGIALASSKVVTVQVSAEMGSVLSLSYNINTGIWNHAAWYSRVAPSQSPEPSKKIMRCLDLENPKPNSTEKTIGSACYRMASSYSYGKKVAALT